MDSPGITKLSVWHLAQDLALCDRDIHCEGDLVWRNYSAIRALCIMRQLRLRFGHGIPR